MSNKSREVIFGSRIRGAKIRAEGAREEAVSRRGRSVVDPNGRYGGPARRRRSRNASMAAMVGFRSNAVAAKPRPAFRLNTSAGRGTRSGNSRPR
jgi:hypothetical protein